MMVSAETQLYKTKAELNYVSNHRDYNYNPELQLHWNLATMAINTRYDDEVINGATSFQEGNSRVYTIKSYRQVKAHREAVHRNTPRSRPSCLLRSRPRFSLSCLLTGTTKSTGWSPKRTLNDNYRVKQHPQVNANCR